MSNTPSVTIYNALGEAQQNYRQFVGVGYLVLAVSGVAMAIFTIASLPPFPLLMKLFVGAIAASGIVYVAYKGVRTLREPAEKMEIKAPWESKLLIIEGLVMLSFATVMLTLSIPLASGAFAIGFLAVRTVTFVTIGSLKLARGHFSSEIRRLSY